MVTPPTVDADAPVDLGEVAARAKRGDAAATASLLGRVRALAHRYCRARLVTYPGGQQLADDVAQDVCVAVLAALPGYRSRGRPFEAFVHGIAAHKVADARRRAARADHLTDEVPDTADDRPTPEQHALAAADLARAATLLEQLPQRMREVVLLRLVAGLTADETGHLLGMSPGAVRVSQHRAVHRLRRLAAVCGRAEGTAPSPRVAAPSQRGEPPSDG